MRILFVCMMSIFIGTCVFAEQAENSIEVEAGKDLVINLPSDMTSGYAWQLAEPIDDEMLQFVDSKYIAPEYPNVSGSKGTEAWTFKTFKAGNAVVSFKYVKATEKDAKPEKEEKFNVTVKPSDEQRLKEMQAGLDRLHSQSFGDRLSQ